MTIFDELESEVRSYCRSWPVIFDRARGSYLWDSDGRQYLDFFSGAGTLNYGHNHPYIKQLLLDYLSEDRIIHGLDMFTVAKGRFLERFDEVILRPRQLDYKLQFPGPTGTNAVEAALKLARKVTGRETVVSFTNAFHGMTLGSLSVTGSSMKRSGAGVPLNNTSVLPYCSFLDDGVDSIDIFEAMLQDGGSGLDRPAAVIVETLQGEGGVNPASALWLRRLAELCNREEILLIVDDIQMGCGRTGPFFSFEAAGIVPDIVTVSKSLSGFGLPFALTLFRPELDIWQPGEHNGTFRGNNPAFVTATAALDFWDASLKGPDSPMGGTGGSMETQTQAKGDVVGTRLEKLAARYGDLGAQARGRGLVWGLSFEDPNLASKVCEQAFDRGLLMETSGPEAGVVKLMPPLTVSVADELEPGLDILEESLETVAGGIW